VHVNLGRIGTPRVFGTVASARLCQERFAIPHLPWVGLITESCNPPVRAKCDPVAGYPPMSTDGIASHSVPSKTRSGFQGVSWSAPARCGKREPMARFATAAWLPRGYPFNVSTRMALRPILSHKTRCPTRPQPHGAACSYLCESCSRGAGLNRVRSFRDRPTWPDGVTIPARHELHKREVEDGGRAEAHEPA